MPTTDAAQQREITIEQLYPDLTSEQQQEAAYWLGRYIAVIKRIHERTQNLTGSDMADTI